MAKKKDTVVIPETSPDETVIENSSTNETYHATFIPTWRAELDCGDHATLEEAQQAVIDVGAEFEADVIPAWHRETPDTWLASGHDGQQDTTMTIAKITRTVAE